MLRHANSWRLWTAASSSSCRRMRLCVAMVREVDSIDIYNDGGIFGGFGELETQGQTIGGPTGLSSTSGQQVLWLYVGAPVKLAAIARQLLGSSWRRCSG